MTINSSEQTVWNVLLEIKKEIVLKPGVCGGWGVGGGGRGYYKWVSQLLVHTS